MIMALQAAGRRLLVQANAALIAVFLAVTAFAVADEVEGRAWPILRDQLTQQVDGPSGELCWRWSLTKARDAEPVSFSWQMTSGPYRYTFVPIPQGEVRPLMISDIPRGGRLDRIFCVPAPRVRDPDRPIIITGHAHYRTHGLWDVRQDFAPVVIP